MARLWQSGFELNSNTTAVEFTSIGGSPTIQTTNARSGTYVGHISSLTSATKMGWLFQWASSASAGPFFARFYFMLHTAPTADQCIFAFTNGGNIATIATTATVVLTLTSTGALKLLNSNTQVGSTSSALTVDTWYRIEVKTDNSGGVNHGAAELIINGSSVASSTTLTTVGTTNSLTFGGNLSSESQTQGDWYFDDLALNNSTGTNQTSYPGAGSIIHLKPSAAGDNTQFTIAGSSPAATNFGSVDEVTPDDATTFVKDGTSGHIDDYDVETAPADLNANSTINVVMVGFRGANASTTNRAIGKIRLKAVSGGTVTLSNAIDLTNTTWKTNANASPWNYPIISYTSPTSGVAWTSSDISTMQIGETISTTGANAWQVSTIWASIDYIPASAGGDTTPHWPILTGSHFSGPRFS